MSVYYFPHKSSLWYLALALALALFFSYVPELFHQTNDRDRLRITQTPVGLSGQIKSASLCTICVILIDVHSPSQLTVVQGKMSRSWLPYSFLLRLFPVFPLSKLVSSQINCRGILLATRIEKRDPPNSSVECSKKEQESLSVVNPPLTFSILLICGMEN